jgi:hypothetical protein
MNEEFKMWLITMYFDNCKERETHNQKPYDSVNAYYQGNRNWLKEKFNNEKVGVK